MKSQKNNNNGNIQTSATSSKEHNIKKVATATVAITKQNNNTMNKNTSNNSCTSIGNSNNYNDDLKSGSQQEATLKVIARMFRQHADLFLKQATYLEAMSLQIKQKSKKADDNEISGLLNKMSDDYYFNDKKLPPCRESLQDKIRRETVVDLAKKSYEGMREVKKIVDVLMIHKTDHQINNRRKHAFEFFAEEILTKIAREDKMKKMINEAKEKNDTSAGKDNYGVQFTAFDNNEINEYIFRRTQEEWLKLTKPKIKKFAALAASDQGVKHIDRQNLDLKRKSDSNTQLKNEMISKKFRAKKKENVQTGIKSMKDNHTFTTSDGCDIPDVNDCETSPIPPLPIIRTKIPPIRERDEVSRSSDEEGSMKTVFSSSSSDKETQQRIESSSSSNQEITNKPNPMKRERDDLSSDDSESYKN